jgi:hypothetical protein
MTSINLSIDFGGSGLKAIASAQDNIYAFRIAPEVITITKEPPKLNSAFKIDLTKNMWVGFSEERYAVGLLARIEYLACIPLVAPKLDYVIPRTLAAVTAVMGKFEVNKCEINLQLLFPSAEFERTDTTALVRSLKPVLSRFDSPIGQLKVKLKSVDVVPEGFGLTKRFLSVNPQRINDQVSCIMFGHRNTSLYMCVGGQPRHYRSNDKGFARAIEYAKLDPLEGLQNPSLVDQGSLNKYWIANRDWLIENLPPATSISIVGGGPLALVGNRLKEFLEPRGGTHFDGGMPVSTAWFGRKPDELNLIEQWPDSLEFSEGDRRQFCDVYCLWATNEVKQRASIPVSC